MAELSDHQKGESLRSMENQEVSPDILKKFGIIFEPQQTLNQFGGLATFIAFLKKGRFRERLEIEIVPLKSKSLLVPRGGAERDLVPFLYDLFA